MASTNDIDVEAVCAITDEDSVLPDNKQDLEWRWLDQVDDCERLLKRRGKSLGTLEQFQIDCGFTIILNMWDNVVGPRPRHIWFGSKRPADAFYDTLLYHSSKVSLGGELSRTHNPRGKPMFKHYRWQELGFEMAVYVFQCEVQDTPTLFSLCVIFPFDIDSAFAPLHGLITEHVGAITQHFAATCLGMPSLNDVIVNTSPRIQTFCQHISQLGLEGLSMTSLDVAHTYFEAARSQSIRGDLLAKAVSSHLQTQGRSVVVGSQPQAIDYLINTLAMLLPPSDWTRCRMLRPDDNDFNSDLVVQGIRLMDADSRKTVELAVLQSALHAVTLIDMDSGTVKQTQREDKMAHMISRRQADRYERVRTGSTAATTAADQLFKFRDVRYQAPLVAALLKDIKGPRLPNYKRALLQHFVRSLHRKALSLLQYAYSHAVHRPSLTDAQLSTLRKELHLSNDEDFELIVATAAGLDENTYALLFQPTDAREQKLASLLLGDLI
eukprot:m.224041 g.224041  ORF g.224041 m.224041 type:complete len:495 (+) comp17279_c0_seq9:1585-3069(+)